MPYYFDASKLYRIWIGRFLPQENQLRLVRMRQNNPSANISLIYSKKCLTPSQLDELMRFCTKHKITLVCFEDFEKKPLSSNDKKLYKIAQEEIQHYLNDTGGNPAAASDCIRAMEAVILECGIYGDFDVGFAFKSMTHFQADAPVIFNVEIGQDPGKPGSRSMQANCDFLACSQEEDGGLSRDALAALANLQKSIIKNYRVPISFAHLNFEEHPTIKHLKELFLTNYRGEEASVYNFRAFLLRMKNAHENSNRRDIDATIVGECLRILLETSVICFSGPGNYPEMYRDRFPKDATAMPLYIPEEKIPDWQGYLELNEKSSVQSHPLLKKVVRLTNTLSGLFSSSLEVISDKSWTPEGALSQRSREKGMNLAAEKIQSFFLKRSLRYRAVNVCSDDSCLKAIKERDYSLALRKASAAANLALVWILIKLRKEVDFDVTETSSNGLTALGWANKLNEACPSKRRLVELLGDAEKVTEEEKLAWRSLPRLAEKLLQAKAAKVCGNDSCLKAIKERDYSLALRKASAAADLELVSILIQIHKKVPFDLNKTSSNGLTALGWANKLDETCSSKRRLVKLLENAGAKTAEELSVANAASA